MAPARPRALGVVGALTFLGMAAGPFVGATILGVGQRRGRCAGPALDPFLAPAWRWVFYINIPIGLIALLLGWAASAGWDTPRRAGRLDLRGAALVRPGAAARARRADARRDRFHRGQRGRAGLGHGVPARRRRRDDGRLGPARAPRRRPVPRPAAVRRPDVLRGVARVAADRLRVRDGDHRGRRLRRPRHLRRAGPAAAGPRRARRRDRGRGARLRASRSASSRSGR